MQMYNGGRLFAGICSVLSVLLFLVVWFGVGASTAAMFGLWSALIGFVAGLLAALPLRMMAELLQAVFDMAENSHKLVALGLAPQQQTPRPDKIQSPEKTVYEIRR